jgi:dienelactone hydrolase
MTLLVPTVCERLARCGTSVYVGGLVPQATVIVSIDADEYTFTATASAQQFTVPPLAAGAKVKARQDDGSGFTPDSPVVVVEDALVPPTSAPLLPAEVGTCSECVQVKGVVPGCQVEISHAGALVGHAEANRFGAACVSVALGRVDASTPIQARMVVCGLPGPKSTTPLVLDSVLQIAPLIGAPLYGCQRAVPVIGLRRGAHVLVLLKKKKSSAETVLFGEACACATAVNVSGAIDLPTGGYVSALQQWAEGPCAAQDEGPASAWRQIVAPDAGIKPVVFELLVAGDQTILVGNQIAGAKLTILVRSIVSDDPPAQFGPRAAGADLEIALNVPLEAAQQVAVVQQLCDYAEQSDWVTVESPTAFSAPVIVPPLYDCAGAVQVSGLHPAALVRVYQDGIVVGLGWAGGKSSIAVAAAPSLVMGGTVTAIQWVGGQQSPASAPITVQGVSLVHPRILEPVAWDDNAVWVSGVTPGARVGVYHNDTLLGEVDAAEPIVRVPITGVYGAIHASARLCSLAPLSSAAATPLIGPDIERPPEIGEVTWDLGGFLVPPHPDGVGGVDGDFVLDKMEGRLYYPAFKGQIDASARDRPLVVVAHGLWQLGENSYLGYDYLARHLARWGMFVFSLNMDYVNDPQPDPKSPKQSAVTVGQWSRGEVIREAAKILLNHPELKQLVSPDRVGLVGHSMSGEGVVVAQQLSLKPPKPFVVRGVVSLAPVNYLQDVKPTTKYLQLYGSLDYLLSGGVPVQNYADHVGIRIYDRAWRPKSLAWIYGATHPQFNRVWSTLQPDSGPDVITLAEQERITRGIVNAFFQDALVFDSRYAGYLEGLILPRQSRKFRIYMQHHALKPTVIDDFGDASDQLGFAAEAPQNKTVNRRGGAVTAVGDGLALWEDVEHTMLARSAHDTRSVELKWTAPTVVYTSDTNGPVKAALTDVLAMRLAQYYEDAATNPVDEDVDLFVELSDANGATATLRVGSVGTVPYPAAAAIPLIVFRTVRLPMDAFHAANPALSLGAIAHVSLRLAGRPTGHIVVDDIEFSA